jgi:hypothetical protein
MHLSRKSLLTLLSAAIVLVGGFYYFFIYTRQDSSVLSSTEPATEAELSFISLFGELGAVTFDTRLLDDPRFSALVDIRTPIVPETAGRKDPFGPLGR